MQDIQQGGTTRLKLKEQKQSTFPPQTKFDEHLFWNSKAFVEILELTYVISLTMCPRTRQNLENAEAPEPLKLDK